MTTERPPFQPSPTSAASSSISGRGHGSMDSVNTSTSAQSSNTCEHTTKPRLVTAVDLLFLVAINTTSTKSEPSPIETPSFPPPKTDKPRPHICGTCARSFARLEHLKRHERSHTKEKPFECPECTRCFARRDLLLRHQQKLHLTGAPSSRAKGVRRESSGGISTTSAKVRKSSAAGSVAGNPGKNGLGNMRPRANTISHAGASGLFAGGQRLIADHGGAGYDITQDMDVLRGQNNYPSRTNTAGHGRPRTMSEVTGFRPNVSGPFGLRTVPSEAAMDGLFDFDEPMPTGSTVNPAQLNLGDALESLESFTWMRGADVHHNYNIVSESAIDATSPSAMSTESPAVVENLTGQGQHQSNLVWSPDMGYHPDMSHFAGSSNPMEYGIRMQTMPSSSLGRTNFDNHYPTPPPMSSLSPNMPMNGLNMDFQAHNLPVGPDHFPMVDRASDHLVGASAVASITEHTRQSLIFSLSQPFSFGAGARKFSQPYVASPTSPNDGPKSPNFTVNFPSTEDLQRYVNAYIHYCHPHLPFLHIPTLSFDSPAYSNHQRFGSQGSIYAESNVMGGGGCLILSMAAIGALYEFNRHQSKELFDAAKKLIQLNLEERRKADLAAASNTFRNSKHTAQYTPVWLVQAMLLNVIYGHNCGDKVSGDIASTHCAALVSLARAADLVKPASDEHNTHAHLSGQSDSNMSDGVGLGETWDLGHGREDEQTQWYRWAAMEERKRTLYALFHMSSILVSAYNHAPALMNSEIQLDLPCEEDLWAAENSKSWMAKGGAEGAKQSAIPFSTALRILLTASQTQNEHQALNYNQAFGSALSGDAPFQNNFQPSTFGCLTLINALHNYIWETRQQHAGRPWTTQETEAMYAHIEPALRAWSTAWASNPTHSIQRPNPFGGGPLSADSIPLLDLAYVRLFVNLGVSKEAFWQRDFDGMAEELARGSDIITHAERSEIQSSAGSAPGSRKASNADNITMDDKEGLLAEENLTVPPPSFVQQQSRSSKRERHLRKAAFYAADSLSMSEKLGVTFADFNSRELPVQSALCTFDCTQVLAEWVSTVQERVGRYLGVLGKTPIDLTQVPAILLLEDEDCKLLEKIQDILNKAESRMSYDISGMDPEVAMVIMNSLPSCSNTCYGSQLLMVTAYMLEKAAVWPVTSLMAQGLQTQAVHMDHRAENSTVMTPN